MNEKVINQECPVLGRFERCDRDGVDVRGEKVGLMLDALATVVVDELMRLKNAGVKTSEVKAVYGAKEVEL